VSKLVWRVKLVAELQAGEPVEVELARFERDEQAGLAGLGLRLAEAKQLTAAVQAEMVPAQVATVGERRRSCMACGGVLASKGHYPATFRSLFGDVPVRVRRLLTCPCQGSAGAKSFAVLDLDAATVAPELAYVTARYAALAPFGTVAALLSELLPTSGARNAGTVRNRTLRVGATVVQPHAAKAAEPTTTHPAAPVVVGLDGGHVRSWHRHEERHFEVVAGKVIDAEGTQSRFAFARNGRTIASNAFKQALAGAGIQAKTSATVLCDGDAGLWRLQREALPEATVVLDWWHAAVRFEHALQAARSLGAGTAEASLADIAVRAAWSVPSGACGTGAGRDAGAGSRPCAAGRRASLCARWPASGVSSGTPVSCWATSSATKARWFTMPAGVDAAADLDCVRGECGQRDRGQAHEQETADALEQDDGAALPRRARRRAERHARGRLPEALFQLPPRERRRGNTSSGVTNPTGLHALGTNCGRSAPAQRRPGAARPWSPPTRTAPHRRASQTRRRRPAPRGPCASAGGRTCG
jgi:hypothetical protein